MIFWVVIGAMTVVALALLLAPLRRLAQPGPEREAYDREVYRDQLEEITRDRARGLLSDDEAASARIEVERRILETGRRKTGPAPARPAGTSGRGLLLAFSLAGVMAALTLYLYLGQPGLRGLPFAERAAAPVGADEAMDFARIDSLVARLAERMEDAPDNLEGWSLLARSYITLGRYDEAARAFAHAASLDPHDAGLAADHGEALVYANGGLVTPAAKQAFEAARDVNAAEPRVRFYLGLAEVQAGRPRAALELWAGLAADAPSDAPWLQELERGIARLKETLGPEADEESD
ncbi:MAG: c-type cytochrome biogenesis protein CcmI [Alphaproteobacteria bacterium]